MKRFGALFLLAFLLVPVVETSCVGLVGANFEPPPTVPPQSSIIELNGTVTPSTAPIACNGGNSYQLTSNIIDQQIWVQKSGITLDGNGFQLLDDLHDFNSGITLNTTQDVTVKNLQISGFYFGIKIQLQGYDPSVGVWGPQPEPDAALTPRDNSIVGCTINECRGAGVEIDDSIGATVSKNVITNSAIGIEVSINWGAGASNNKITSNNLRGNGEGLVVQECDSNTISSNEVVQNTITGIDLYECSNNSVLGNTITQNCVGLLVRSAQNNIITGNQIAENTGWGLRLNETQTNNQIYGNNIIDNNQAGGGFPVSIPMAMIVSNNGKVTINMVSGLANSWNKGEVGNYWSGFQNRYPNATVVNGVWDTAFTINENNIDYYPLVNPLPNPTTSSPQSNRIPQASPVSPSRTPLSSTPFLSSTQTPASTTNNVSTQSPLLPIIAIGVIAALTIAVTVLIFIIRKKPLTLEKFFSFRNISEMEI